MVHYHVRSRRDIRIDQLLVLVSQRRGESLRPISYSGALWRTNGQPSGDVSVPGPAARRVFRWSAAPAHARARIIAQRRPAQPRHGRHRHARPGAPTRAGAHRHHLHRCDRDAGVPGVPVCTDKPTRRKPARRDRAWASHPDDLARAATRSQFCRSACGGPHALRRSAAGTRGNCLVPRTGESEAAGRTLPGCGRPGATRPAAVERTRIRSDHDARLDNHAGSAPFWSLVRGSREHERTCRRHSLSDRARAVREYRGPAPGLSIPGPDASCRTTAECVAAHRADRVSRSVPGIEPPDTPGVVCLGGGCGNIGCSSDSSWKSNDPSPARPLSLRPGAGRGAF